MTIRVIETWNYKGFWVGTEHDKSTEKEALNYCVRRWVNANGEDKIVLVSRDWNFTQLEAVKFRKMLDTGQYQTHKIGFEDWNKDARKWRKTRTKK